MTETDNSWGSPRMPTDPPIELDGKPAAQKLWIETAASNPAIRDLDYDLFLHYCLMAEELKDLEEMQEVMLRIDPRSDRLTELKNRISEKKALMEKLRWDLFPDEP